jgi:hypothetical protein
MLSHPPLCSTGYLPCFLTLSIEPQALRHYTHAEGLAVSLYLLSPGLAQHTRLPHQADLPSCGTDPLLDELKGSSHPTLIQLLPYHAMGMLERTSKLLYTSFLSHLILQCRSHARCRSLCSSSRAASLASLTHAWYTMSAFVGGDD